jgi:hypothetical protein
MYEKVAGPLETFSDWLKERGGLAPSVWTELQRFGAVWADPELYQRRMGDYPSMQQQSVYHSEPAYEAEGEGYFYRSIGPPDYTQQYAMETGQRSGSKEWYRQQGLEPPEWAPGE